MNPPWNVKNLDRSLPLVGQISALLQESIRSGRIPVGSRLPSIRDLARQLGVNRNTVAQVIRTLAEQGVLETHFGGGSVVSGESGLGPDGPGERVPGAMGAVGMQGTLGIPDWERRFARRVMEALGRGTVAVGNGKGETINLYQQRPVTDFFPLEAFQSCLDSVLRQTGRELLNYGTPGGYLPLREEIAGRLRGQGILADPSQVLVVGGSQQGIDLVARAFLDEGDGVVVESPTYSIALRIFTVNGARLHPYRLDPGSLRWGDLEALRHGPPPKLFYTVPNFQNPTTHSYTRDERLAVLEHARALDTLVIEDASDQEFHVHPREWPPLAALDSTGRVIHLNTFSKTLVPALRLGYVCAPSGVIRRLTELKEMTDLSHSLLLQAAIAEFMRRGLFDAHLEQVRRFYHERMSFALETLDKTLPPETPFTRPAGGLCVWVDLPSGVSARRVFEQAQARGVLVSPGDLYRPAQFHRNGLRLCVVNEDESRLAQGFQVLGQVLSEALREPHRPTGPEEYQPIH
ncbi:MAG: PLP-dependent aminotransferase family protein [Deltaproteobacteria bacterium]|nr:PLP-dependent aminotransferase family protein [Deltaproteobacteria bacterium]